jgi:hypothetical protein
MRYEIKLIAEVDEPQSCDTFLRFLQVRLLQGPPSPFTILSFEAIEVAPTPRTTPMPPDPLTEASLDVAVKVLL